ncbi:MAG: choice-of-anchor Q domain-containing protein, partial [Planctomycetota bacterium]
MMGKNTNLKMSLIISAFLLGMGSAIAAGGTIYVDADASVGGDGSGWPAAFKYMQDALRAAVSGDVILVANGIYKPDQDSAQPDGTGLRTDTFRLKNGVAIIGGYGGFGEPDPDARDINGYETVMSGDIGLLNYRGDNSYNVVTGNGTNQTAVLNGFIITAGNANGPDPYNNGSGMVNDHSSPTLTNCTITGNWSEDSGAMNNHNGSSPTLTNCTFSDNSTDRGGGAMKNYMSSPTLINCTFSNNSAGWGGGAINNVAQSHPILTNCTFIGNSSGWSGGGIDNMSSNPTLTNCTFSSNSAGWFGGGMNNGAGSSPRLTNCIIWGNTSQEITTDGEGAIVISFSDVRGGWPGAGNINANPLFVEPAIGDYHLLPDSPCIDAGYNPAVPPSVVTDLDGNPRITGGTVDMGAYELQRPSTLYVDDNASGKNNGSSWDDAFNDLQDALAVVYPGSEIRVAEGIYTPEGPLYSQAGNPNPYNGAGPVRVTADLSWTAGAYATSHDVYFGTSSPGMFQGNQNGTTFDPGTMAMGTKYYWRIDEVGRYGTTTGTIWNFTTLSAPPPMGLSNSHDIPVIPVTAGDRMA